MKTPTTLLILDGFSLGTPSPGNAVFHAETPNLDRIFTENPTCRLACSGLDVGLTSGQMGNSEVGHTNIGAGRVVFQDLPRITKAIEDGSFFENPAFLAAAENCRKHDSALHLMGLLSDGGVHSHITHLFALLDFARRQSLTKVYLHLFLDGRDVAPSSGAGFLRQCLAACQEKGVGTVASVCGRYYAMDRDSRWERLQKAYDAIVRGEAPCTKDPVKALEDSYAAGITDEFFEPVCCDPQGHLRAQDSVIFFNFRPDRARELTRAITEPDFAELTRGEGCFPVTFVCTTTYDATFSHVLVAFPREPLANILGAFLSRLGMTQLRIAETEKYAHVTFFFNGGEEKIFPGEDRVLIPSPKVATYDLQPEMSAHAVTEEAVARIESGKYDIIILNLANCDMVGHTGVFPAAVKAVETVDACVGQLVAATAKRGGITLLTADHGNAEQMLSPDGSPHTAHTTNPVPFCLIGAQVSLRNGRLADIAPTILDIMGLEKPQEMDGESLILP